jgi:hypothetical protein
LNVLRTHAYNRWSLSSTLWTMNGVTNDMGSQSSITPTAVTNSSSSESLTAVFHEHNLQLDKSYRQNFAIVVNKGIIETKQGCSVMNELATVSTQAEKQKSTLPQSGSTIQHKSLQQTQLPNPDQSSFAQGIAPIISRNLVPQPIIIQQHDVVPMQRFSDITSLHSDSVPNTTAATPVSAVPEFLYQLSKMLTDNNRDIIEWNHGMLNS